MIRDNLQEIRSRIQAAAQRSGRDPGDIRLIAVSKFHPVSEIREAMDQDQRLFGENRPQEMRDKAKELADTGAEWHFIGNLQKNKIKYVVGTAAMVHSVNSRELAQAIEEEAARRNVTVPCLIEVNIAQESTKQGLAAEEAEALLTYAAELPHLKICGLMAIAPPVETPEENRPYFRQLRELKEKMAEKQLPGVDLAELSMGMSGDYEVAVEEGATLVRVGTAIFGERKRQN